MLPSKKEMRLSISAEDKKIPKIVQRYLNKAEQLKEYYAIFKIKSINRKRYLCIFWYSSTRLEYVTFWDKKSCDIHTVAINTPVKWYRSNLCSLPFIHSKYESCENKWQYNYALLDRKAYDYYYDPDLVTNPMDFIRRQRYIQIEKNKALKYSQTLRERDKIFSDIDSRKIPKKIINWAKYTVFDCFAIFDTKTPHSVHCAECGKDFVSDSKVKNGLSIKCPHCKRMLKCKSIGRLRSSKLLQEKGFQYLDTNNGSVVVRHFIGGKYLDKGFSYYEYERDVMAMNESERNSYSYRNYILRYKGVDNSLHWVNSKPVYGYHHILFNTCREIYYADEQLYRKNLNDVLANTIYKEEMLNYFSDDTEFRAEDYLSYSNEITGNGYELLLKAQCHWLIKEDLNRSVYDIYNDSILDLNATKPKDVLQVSKGWFKFIRSEHISMPEIEIIQIMYRMGIQVDTYKKVRNRLRLSSRNMKRFLQTYYTLCRVAGFEKCVSYLEQIGPSYANDWFDYVDVYDGIIYSDWNKHSAFPSSIEKLISQHDEAMKIEKLRNAPGHQSELDELFNLRYSTYWSTITNKVIDDYIFIIPKCLQDFIDEGNHNNNCVGRMRYYEKMCNGKSTIVFMRKVDNPEKSFVTIELSYDGIERIQAQGKSHSSISNDVSVVINKYSKYVVTKYLSRISLKDKKASA